MITFKEIDDVKIMKPDADEVTLFYTDQALRFKDENGDVYTLTKQEDLDAIEATKPKVYKALISQVGTAAPTAIVLENTLGGTLVWSYIEVGIYEGTLVGAFTENKVLSIIAQTSNDLIAFSIDRNSNDTIRIGSTENGAASNTWLDKTTVIIEVYPVTAPRL